MRFTIFTYVLVLFGTSVVSLAQVYSPAKIVTVPGMTGSVSPGDFDNDGDDDLLVSGNDIRLFTIQKGKITEQLNTGLPTKGRKAEWIDYDGDHDLDVFVFNLDLEKSTSDFYINTNGIFKPLKISLPSLMYASVSIIDYDQDGDIDIIRAGMQQDGSFKTFLHRNSNNIFTSVELPIDLSGDLQWEDFDGDKDLDVLVNLSYQPPTLYINNGNNSFSPFKSDFIDSGYARMMWADFDNDKDPDVMISNNNTTIFINNGDKTFSKYTGTDLSGGNAKWTDYDKDGDFDIFFIRIDASTGGRIPEIYERKGDGSYAKLQGLGLTRYGAQDPYDQSTFIDYDQDGDNDLFVLYDYNRSMIYRNNLNSNPYPLENVLAWPLYLTSNRVSTSEIKLDWYPSEPDVSYSIEMRIPGGDFTEMDVTTSDRISLAGLIFGIPYDFRVRTKKGELYSRYSEIVTSTTASPDFTPFVTLPAFYVTKCASWADMDNDGDPDLSYSGFDWASEDVPAYSIGILRNDNGNFVSQSQALPSIYAHTLDWADFDLDGDMDLLLSGYKGGGVVQTKIMINNGNFNFVELAGTELLGVSNGFAKWLDINGDGYLDIYISGVSNAEHFINSSQILINKRNGSFEEIHDSGLPILTESYIATGDFNDDGRVDIVVTGIIDSKFYPESSSEVYLNQGGNKFSLNQKLESAFSPVHAADFDSDGDLDISVGGKIYWNEKGNFIRDKRNNFFTTDFYGDQSVGDIDNDGDVDIIISGGGHLLGKSNAYLNDGTGLFIEGSLPLSWYSGQENQYLLVDFDSDQDLDVYQTAGLLQNQSTTINTAPGSPFNIKAKAAPGSVIMKWSNGADDFTASRSLISNVYLKNSEGKYLYNSLSDISTGRLKKPAMGNAFLADSMVFRGLDPGTYEVGVQNIDNSFLGSPFAMTTVNVTLVAPALVSKPVACANSKVNIEVLGNEIVWYSDEALTNQIGLGNIFSATVGNSNAIFYVVQRSGTQVSPALKVTVKIYPPITGQIVQSGGQLIAPAADSYQWFKNGTLIEGAVNRELAATELSKYSLKTANGGCVTDTISYFIRPPKPQPSSPEDICVKERQLIKATGVENRWYNREGTLIGMKTNTFQYDKMDLSDSIIFVTQTIQGVESEKASASWRLYPFPDSKLLLHGDLFTASKGLSYQWYKDDTLVNGATEKELSVSTNGLYFVEVSNLTCSTTSEKVTFTSVEKSDPSRLIAHDLHKEALYIWTPASDQVSEIRIVDSTGKEVMKLDYPEKSMNREYTVDTHGLRPGMYVAQIGGSNPFGGKFVKTK